MKVYNFSIKEEKDSVTFSADFSFKRRFPRRKAMLAYAIKLILKDSRNIHSLPQDLLQENKHIFFTVPKKHVETRYYQDAFFIIGLVLALKLEEELEFNGSVSPEVLNKASDIEKFYRFESAPRKIIIKGATPLERTQTQVSADHAQFFSLGLDSFYTLFKQGNSLSKNHFLFIDGYDVPLSKRNFLENIHTRIKKVAQQVNSEAVFVKSNLRELNDSIMNWGQFHIVALAAAGTLLNFKSIHISGESFDWPDWGLRYGVDDLFSTSRLRFKLIGHNVSRDMKIKFIKQNDNLSLFLEHLRVCWKNADLTSEVYNCSECQKCLRTKLLLLALGIKKTPTLKDVDLKALAKIEMVGHVRSEWTTIYRLLEKEKTTSEALLQTLRFVLEKPLRY